MAKVSQQKLDMVRPSIPMFKPLLARPSALAKSEIFASSHRDNPELSDCIIEVESRMQSDHRRKENVARVLQI